MRKELWFGFTLMALLLMGAMYMLLAAETITYGHLGLLMLGLVVAAIMLGFPTAFTLMGMGMLFGWFAYGFDIRQVLDLMVQRTYAVMANDVLIAVPLFVFMGYLVERANLIEQLFRSLHLAMSRIPGSLAVATIVTCAIFATATGIVGAVVTLMGLLAMPQMLKAGYHVQIGAGAITAGGCLGILIPPSVLLIVYGATAGVSVVQLYAGAFFPGLMLAGLYVGYVILLAKIKPRLMPPLPMEERHVALPPLAERLSRTRQRALTALTSALKGPRNADIPMRTIVGQLFITLLPLFAFAVLMLLIYRGYTTVAAVEDYSELQQMGLPVEEADAEDDTLAGVPTGFWIAVGIGVLALAVFYRFFNFVRLEIFKMLLGSFFPLAVLILMVLGSIVFGLATPSEAAAAGALGGILLAAAYGQLNFSVVRESVYLTAKTSAMVCWLFVGSSIFSASFALLGGQDIIERWVLSLGLTPIEFLILAQVIIFLLGWPLEWTEIIVIFMPIFVPLLPHYGIDPLFFGLLVALNLQTAFLSPPVAMAAYYLKGVSPPHVTLNQIFLGMLPFMGIQVLAIVILYVFPAIGLWLPSVLYGR